MTTRRFFLSAIPAGALALGLTPAEGAVALAETDPAATALGYKADATKVDTKKYANYVKGQVCSGCQLYAGKAGDAAAPCAAFAGKLVNAKGWCMVWAKRA